MGLTIGEREVVVTLEVTGVEAEALLGVSAQYGLGNLDPAELGGVVTKGISPLPRKGNPPPRICETEAGFLNSIGHHRAHHSVGLPGSHSNYGSFFNFADRMFGTRYLPADREVADLGLINRHYPRRFVEQLFTPFVPKLDKVDARIAKNEQ